MEPLDISESVATVVTGVFVLASPENAKDADYDFMYTGDGEFICVRRVYDSGEAPQVSSS